MKLTLHIYTYVSLRVVCRWYKELLRASEGKNKQYRVFCVYEDLDSPANLSVAVGRYREQINEKTWR